MSSKVKILLIAAGFFLLAPVIAILVFYQDDAKSIISSYVESRSGRGFSVGGDVGIRWALIPTIYAKKVRLENAGWAQSSHAFTADEMLVSFSLIDMFKGQLNATAIKFINSDLWIERHPETGQFNLDMRQTTGRQPRSRLLPEWVGIKELSIRNGSINYLHKGREWEIDLDQATIGASGLSQETTVSVQGAVEQTPVSFSGKLGNFESLVNYRETSVELDGYVGAAANRVSVTGVVQELLRWHGLNLWVNSQFTDLADLSDLFGFWLPSYKGISAKFELIQPGSPRTMRLESVYIESSDYGLDAYLAGEIGNAVQFKEVDIQFRASGNLDKNLVSNGLIDEVRLDTNIAGSIKGDREDLSLDIEHGTIAAQGVSITASGGTGNLLNDWSMPVALEIKADSLASVGNLFGLALPDTPPVKASVDLTRQSSRFDFSRISVSGSPGNQQFSLQADGELSNPGKQQIGKIQFDMYLDKKILKQLSDSKYLVLINGLSTAGTMQMEGNEFLFTDLDFHAIDDGINLIGNGSAGFTGGAMNLNIDIELTVDSVSRLESLVSHKLPETIPFKLSGTLSSDPGGILSLHDIVGKLDDPALSMNATGRVNNIAVEPEAALDFSWLLKQVDPINTMYPEFRLYGLLERLLPISGGGKFTGTPAVGYTDYAFIDIEATTLSENFDGRISGDFNHLFGKGTSATETLQGGLAMELSGVINDDTFTVGEFPLLSRSLFQGLVKGSADIAFSSDNISLGNIDVHILADQSDIKLSGAVAGVSPLQTEDLKLEFEADSFDELLDSPRVAYFKDQPVNGSVKFGLSGDSQNYSIMLRAGDSDLSGLITNSDTGSDTGPGTGKYQVTLFSENLNLVQLLNKAGESETVFSTTPLNFDWLSTTSAEIELNVNNFISGKLALDDLTAVTSISQGKLHTELSGESFKGPLEMTLDLEKHNRGANVRFHARGRNVDISAIPDLGKTAADNAGEFSLNIDIAGVGQSISEIAGSADGVFLLELNGAQVKRKGLKFLSRDMVVGILNTINPLSRDSEFIDIECSAIHLIVEDGLAWTEQGIAIQTDEFALLGGGNVDLNDEAVKLVVSSKARKGLGINTNSLIKLIRVGGTLSSPEIETDSSGILQSGVAIGAAIVSGGLSLLAQGLYDKHKANADVCGTAAENAEYPEIEIVVPKEDGR
jgi:uncharacterized protein involved in outer membrane biogenesis